MIFGRHCLSLFSTELTHGRLCQKFTLTVDYGYDIHSVEASRDDWERALAGERISFGGQGFYVEGVREDDYWSFNYPLARRFRGRW